MYILKTDEEGNKTIVRKLKVRNTFGGSRHGVGKVHDSDDSERYNRNREKKAWKKEIQERD